MNVFSKNKNGYIQLILTPKIPGSQSLLFLALRDVYSEEVDGAEVSIIAVFKSFFLEILSHGVTFISDHEKQENLGILHK